MNTIGDLMVSLRKSGAPCFWMGMMCRRSSEEVLATLKGLPICEDNVARFCLSVVAEIQNCLIGVDTEERFASILKEGHEFLEAVFEQVKDKGIRKELVCNIPISYSEMAEQAGVVQINDGMVSLTEEGEVMAKEISNSITGNPSSTE